MTTAVWWVWWVCVATLAGGARPPGTVLRSELGDLWRERDAIYLRADGHVTRQPGVLPAGTVRGEVRVSAMVRGRTWPGRWTMLELDVRGEPGERLLVGWSGEAAERMQRVTLLGRREERLRLALEGSVPRDVVLRSEGGLRGRLELGRVWVVDDRWVLWPAEASWESPEAGEWRVERRAGRWRVGTETFPGDWEVVEVNGVRALLSGTDGTGAAVYASGRVWRTPRAGDRGGDRGVDREDAVGGVRWSVRVDEDQGRVVRTRPGDVEGVGFDGERGVAVVRAGGGVGQGAARRIVFEIEPVGAERVSRPVVEVQGLAAGDVRVLWEGTLVRSTARLADGTLLIEVPGEVVVEGASGGGGGGRVEVRVQ